MLVIVFWWGGGEDVFTDNIVYTHVLTQRLNLNTARPISSMYALQISVIQYITLHPRDRFFNLEASNSRYFAPYIVKEKVGLYTAKYKDNSVIITFDMKKGS